MGKGMRRIVVDGQSYRWRFDEVLVVIPHRSSGPQLYVDWGWRNWLEPEGPGPAPPIVTPRFVAAAIRFALAQRWQSEVSGPPLRLVFESGSFRVVSNCAGPFASLECGDGGTT